MRAKIIQRATTLTAAMQYTIFAQLTWKVRKMTTDTCLWQMKNLTPSMLLYSFINYMAKKVIVILALGLLQ